MEAIAGSGSEIKPVLHEMNGGLHEQNMNHSRPHRETQTQPQRSLHLAKPSNSSDTDRQVYQLLASLLCF